MRRCFTGFAIVFVLALLGGLTGAGLGWMRMKEGGYEVWKVFSDAYGVKDLGHFVWVSGWATSTTPATWEGW
jgi:hypothetical protein